MKVTRETNSIVGHKSTRITKNAIRYNRGTTLFLLKIYFIPFLRPSFSYILGCFTVNHVSEWHFAFHIFNGFVF